MLVDLNTFQALDFPKHRDIVYVLCYKNHNDNHVHPFYVGESSRHIGRVGDYVSANFTASTDFKVGEAVTYLRQLGCHIEIKFKEAIDRKAEEKALLHEFRQSHRLLNDLVGYNYLTANVDEERSRIRKFIDELLSVNTQVFIKQTIQIFQDEAHIQMTEQNSSIPEKIRSICQELDAAYDEAVPGDKRFLSRKDILKIAEERGINRDSAQPADYCDNGKTSQHSRHSFLHSIEPGRYILNRKWAKSN